MSEVDSLPAWHGASLLYLPPIGSAVRHVLSRTSTCVPDDAMVLTYVTAAHVQLRHLQLQRVRSLRCFMARVVTVCFGNNSLTQLACGPRGGTCVPSPSIVRLGRRRDGGEREAKYGQAPYHALIWAKWRFMYAALQHARQVLFLDADVVVFQNPFDVLRRYEWQYVQRERQVEAAGSVLQLGPSLQQPPASQRPLTGTERTFAKEYLQLDLLYQGLCAGAACVQIFTGLHMGIWSGCPPPLIDARPHFPRPPSPSPMRLAIPHAPGELACQAPPACFDWPANRHPGTRPGTRPGIRPGIRRVEPRHATSARPLAHCHLNGGVLLLRR